MRYITLILLCVLAALNASAQKGDSLLLNETTLSRPLNVHRHQLRISGGHLLALTSTQFIGSDKKPEKETGRTRTFSGIDLDIKYGVTEYLQARFVLNRTAEIITEPAFFAGFGNQTYINNNSSQKIGWEDPEIWIDYRIPFKGSKTDLVFNLGSSLSVMKSGAVRPSLRIAPSGIVFEEGFEFQRISVVENLLTGNGVNRLGYGIQVKHRFKKVAINFQGRYYLPLGTETVDRWILSNTGFEYVKESYERQIPDQLTITTGIEAQIRPWLNVSVDGVMYRSRYGWNEKEGKKILVPTSELVQARLSYEIIATKRLWLGQSLNMTLSAMDVYAPVLLTTFVKYNLFL